MTNEQISKKDKFYCKNCIWSNKRVFDTSKFCPLLKDSLRKQGINLTYCGDGRTEMISSEECSYYQRKWYKFWVK